MRLRARHRPRVRGWSHARGTLLFLGGAEHLLLVASGGGHLKQLHRLLPRFESVVGAPRVWVTYDTPQSRAVLRGEQVLFAHHPTTRNIPNALRNLMMARRVIADLEPTLAISTGAAVALPFLAVAASRGCPAHYIESATRVTGPSLTGRLMRGVPRVRRYTQHAGWSGGGWRYGGSVFDGFSVATRSPAVIRRVVVSLGTHGLFPFSRLLTRLIEIIPPEADVLWQTGSTPVNGLPIRAVPALGATELEDAMRRADLVVAHAGTGAALSALEAGRLPVLVPRIRQRGEHVDDHQSDLAAALENRGLALNRDADNLSGTDLEFAASRVVQVAASLPPFDLVG